MRVLSPVGETQRENVTLPASFAGRTVSFVDNTSAVSRPIDRR